MVLDQVNEARVVLARRWLADQINSGAPIDDLTCAWMALKFGLVSDLERLGELARGARVTVLLVKPQKPDALSVFVWSLSGDSRLSPDWDQVRAELVRQDPDAVLRVREPDDDDYDELEVFGGIPTEKDAEMASRFLEAWDSEDPDKLPRSSESFGVACGLMQRRLDDLWATARELGFEAEYLAEMSKRATLDRLTRGEGTPEDLAWLEKFTRPSDAEIIASFARAIGADESVVKAVRNAVKTSEGASHAENERRMDLMGQAVEVRMRATATAQPTESQS